MPGKDFLSFLLALNGRQRRLAGHAAIGLPRLQRQIRQDGLRTTLDSLSSEPNHLGLAADHDELAAFGAVVNRVAGVRVIRATCLTRSIFLKHWLEKRNIDSTVRIGVRTDTGTFAAHAWLEHDGLPINDSHEAVSAFLPIADLGRDIRAGSLGSSDTWRALGF